MAVVNIALFDFCKTLVNFQTADAFIWYVCENIYSQTLKKRIRTYQLLKATYIPKIVDLFYRKSSLNKMIIVRIIRGIDYETLNFLAHQYYINRIKPALIDETIKVLENCKKQGMKVYLVSGGYDIYLKYFIREYHLDGYVSTKLEFKNGLCTGKFDGKDCLNRQKVKFINELLKETPYNQMKIWAYSDSKRDLPLLKWADRGIVVSQDNSRQWAAKNNLEEIIWKSSSK